MSLYLSNKRVSSPSYHRDNGSLFIGIIFLFMGLITFCLGIYNVIINMAPSNYLEEKGRVVDNGIVEFVVEGETYQINVAYDAYFVGTIVEVVYNPKNPQECKIVKDSLTTNIAVFVSVAVGASFSCVGILLVKIGGFNKRKIESSFGNVE